LIQKLKKALNSLAKRRGVEKKLRESESFVNMAFDSIRDPFMILDRDYRIVKCNEAYAQMRRIQMTDLPGKKCFEAIYGRKSVCRDCIVEKTFLSGDPCAKDKAMKTVDGTEAWFEIYTYPMSIEKDGVTHVIEYIREITDRKRTEMASKLAHWELEQIFNTAGDAMCVIDEDYKILRVNWTFSSLFGSSREEAVGKKCYEIFPGPQCNTLNCSLTKILSGRDHIIQFESEKKLKDGRGMHFIVTATALRGSDGELIGIIEDLKDISQRKRMEDELRSLSLRDELTGLYNRRGFFALAGQELRRADRLKKVIFMLYADLDGLKIINDTLGHEVGDEALRRIGAVLSETFRNSDIVARIGGDEFAVIPIEKNGGRDLETVTLRLQKNIDICNSRIDRNYKLSLSVGAAYYDPQCPCSVNELVIKADKLMYEQKRRRAL
jgi:diguanylate cyclase (GGDEF)-like protein/PAS domain S-box-containing protein